MISKPKENRNDRDLFRAPILDFANENHPVIVLANKIDWTSLKGHFDRLYNSGLSQPLLRICLILDLDLIKYLENLSDKTVVEKLTENSYCQHIYGNV